MPMVATMKPYTLFVVDDDMPLNPRTDYDNLGKMVCWHSRYNLGDEHDYDEPRDFLQKKLFEMYSSYPSSQYGKPIYDFIKSGKAETAKLEYVAPENCVTNTAVNDENVFTDETEENLDAEL